MTTPPLDLTQNDLDIIRLIADGGNRNDVMTIKNTTVLALLDRVEKAERACQTLGRVIDRQCEDALTATDSQDLLWGNDGDGDWGAIWERVLGLGEKAREATARAEAAERDLAAVTVSRDGWQTRAKAAEKKVAAVIDWCDTNQHPFHPSEGAVGFSRQDWALDDAARRVRTMLTTPETETTP